MQPYRMPSPARRRWGPAGGAAPPSPPPSPGTTTVDVKVVSPAGSPCAAPPVWTRPPIVGSPHSPQLSRRSHDGRGAWSPGYAASVGSDSDTGAAADDLLDFLADLKNKYGLAQPRPAQPAPGQQQVNVRVQVQQGCAGHAAPCAQQLAVQHPQLLLPALHLQHGHGHAAQPGSPGWQYGQQYEQTTFSAGAPWQQQSPPSPVVAAWQQQSPPSPAGAAWQQQSPPSPVGAAWQQQSPPSPVGAAWQHGAPSPDGAAWLHGAAQQGQRTAPNSAAWPHKGRASHAGDAPWQQGPQQVGQTQARGSTPWQQGQQLHIPPADGAAWQQQGPAPNGGQPWQQQQQPQQHAPRFSFDGAVGSVGQQNAQVQTSSGAPCQYSPQPSSAAWEQQPQGPPSPRGEDWQQYGPLRSEAADQQQGPPRSDAASWQQGHLRSDTATLHQGPLRSDAATQHQAPLRSEAATQQQGPPRSDAASWQQGPLHSNAATQQQGLPRNDAAVQQQGPPRSDAASWQQEPLRSDAASQHARGDALWQQVQPAADSAVQPLPPQPLQPQQPAVGGNPEQLLPTSSWPQQASQQAAPAALEQQVLPAEPAQLPQAPHDALELTLPGQQTYGDRGSPPGMPQPSTDWMLSSADSTPQGSPDKLLGNPAFETTAPRSGLGGKAGAGPGESAAGPGNDASLGMASGGSAAAGDGAAGGIGMAHGDASVVIRGVGGGAIQKHASIGAAGNSADGVGGGSDGAPSSDASSGTAAHGTVYPGSSDHVSTSGNPLFEIDYSVLRLAGEPAAGNDAAGSGSGADARGSSPGSTSGEPLAAAAAEQAAASADTAAQLAGDLQQHQQEQQQQQQQQGGTLDSHMEVELAMLEEAQLAMEEAQRNAVAAAAGEQHATPQPAGRQQQDGATSAAGHGDGTHSAASGREWLVPPPRGRRLPWGSLHTLLVRRGFPGLFATEEEAMAADYTELEPDIVTCFDVIHSLLEDQTRVAAHHRRLSESISAAQRREAAIVHSFTTAAKRRAAETNKWKRLTIDNQIAVRDARIASKSSTATEHQAVVAAKRLEGEVNQLTHELRGKEAELERMRNMLRVQAERDERRAQADREAYDRVKRAHAASKVADTPNAAEAAVRMAARDMRPIDICRLFEAERANLAEAAAAVAADAAAARAQLEIAQEALHAAGLPCERFEEIEGQARSAARAVAAAEERARAAAEAVAMLQLEVAARPTQAQYDSLKRQATIMERQLAKAAAERKAAEEDKGTIKSVHPKTKQLSTRDMMLRDRNMQRLGLQAVEEMPKPVLVEVVQDACALLECSTPLELCAAIKPVQDLAALVPRMERFIGDVCGAVFQAGLAHVPEALRQDNPADVPAILGAWVSELGELVETRGVLRALLRQLASRVSLQPNDPAPTASEVVPLVHQLVELERKVYHSREVLEAAETALAAQPDILINRICLQFQRLFGCKSLQGILPAMNKLYLAHTEAQTFLSSLRVALGLEPGATLEACANRMQQLLEAKRAELGSLLPAKEPPGAAPVLPRSAEAVVVEVAPRRRTSGHGPHGELQAAGQVAVERMAARRHWPQVEIYVPAADPEAADGPAAAAQPAAAARQSPEASAPVPPMALSVQG